MASTGESTGPDKIEQWLDAARQGSSDALGRVLDWCRPYLLQVANDNLGTDLRAKAGASDLVQETFLDAQRDFGTFRGLTEEGLRAWLRCILLHNLASLNRHYRHTDKRRLRREIALANLPGEESIAPLMDREASPSSQMRARERDDALEEALAQLPPVHQQAIRLRNYERLSFAAAGERMGVSAAAARKLWGRAVERLQAILEAGDEP